MRAALLALVVVFGCGDSARRSDVISSRDGGPGGPNNGCTRTGDLIDLGPGVPPRVVRAGDTILLRSTSGTVETRTVTADALGAAMPIGLSRDVSLVGSSSTAFAVSIPPSVFVDGVFIRQWTGSVWVEPTVASSGAVGPSGIVRSRAAAASDNGALAIVWAIDGEVQVLDWTPSGFSAPSTIPSVVHTGAELHVVFGADGALHVLTSVDGTNGIDLVYVRRRQGTWAAPVTVARAEGALSNIVISGLAMMGTTPVAAQTYGGSMGTAGATIVYRIEDGVPAEMGRVTESRVVSSGLAIDASADDVLVSVAHGANNLDPAESMDSVDLVRCDAAGCKRALSIRDAKGHFYESSALARTAVFGIAVWAEEPKLGIDGMDRTAAQRFGCP